VTTTRGLAVLLAAAALLFVSGVQAQAPPATPPCRSAPEFRQLDFWVGEWEVRNAQGQAVGESSIQLILGDCVVFENWTGRDGFTGKSFNLYDRRAKQWEQTWVDASGAVRRFQGKFEDGALRYLASDFNREGRPILIKMVLEAQSDGRVRQLSEFSSDGGATWQPRYDFTYTRRATAAGLSQQDESAIRGVLATYARGWLEGKPKVVMSAFLEDAVILPHHGDEPHAGAEAIRRFWWPPDSPPFRVTRLEQQPDEITGEGNLAYVRGHFALTFIMEQDGTPRTFSNAGTFLMVLRRNAEGEWRIAQYMWDDPLPQMR